MNTTTWLAIGLGGIAGAFAALAGATRPSVRPPLPPVAAVPTEREPGPADRVVAPGATPSGNVEPQASGEKGAPGNAPEPAITASASASEAPPSAPAVASKEELARAVIGCREKRVPSDCRTAALGYEQGIVVPSNPAEAKILRTIELTLLVRQCDEAQLPSACAALIPRYERGEGVTRSQKSADALRERVKELCSRRAGRGDAACP